MLGPSMILAGTPLALIYALRCWRRSPRSRVSAVALVIAVVEAAALAWLMAWAALR